MVVKAIGENQGSAASVTAGAGAPGDLIGLVAGMLEDFCDSGSPNGAFAADLIELILRQTHP